MSPKRLGLLLGALVALATTGLLAGHRPSAAEIDDTQRTSWGLATFGPSRTVANFSSLGWALEEIDGRVYSGGRFLDVTDGQETRRQPYLAAFETEGGAHDPSFAPQVGGPVLALHASPDGGLFVGGEMGTWNGTQIGALTKIDPATGATWPGWNTRAYGGTSVVRDLSLGPDGWLYVAGTFTTASDAGNPTPVASVIRLDPVSGAIDWTWLPQTTGGVWGIAASHTQPTVYIVGWTDVIGPYEVVGVGSTDPGILTWTGFTMNYPCCSHMYDVVATDGGKVFVGGEQHALYVYDEAQGMALIRNHVTSYDSRYQDSNARRGGDYQRLEQVGDRVYATCHCWGAHATGSDPTPVRYSSNLALTGGTHTGLVSGVIAYDAVTGHRDQAFDPYLAGDLGGWGVLGASDGCLWVTGGFNAVGQPGSQQPARDLVRLCDEGHVDPVPPVTPHPTCLATFAGETVTVTWDASPDAVETVIYRSVDGGRFSWRGRVADASFVDTNRDAALVYAVAARDGNGVKSELTECGSEVVVGQPLAAPANCEAAISGASVAVTWDEVAEATEYVVYRSVDGGPQYWRGRVAATSFDDTNRDASLTYYVSAKAVDGERSERAPCTTVDNTPPPPPVPAIASCTVTGPDEVNGITVGWDAVDAVDPQYIVYRSVDGGTWFWRGRVGATTFDDTLRAGSIEYAVEVKVGNDRSERVPCQPTVIGQ